MLLLNKPKKLQLGGSLNQARNENAKVDNAWNKIDASSMKNIALQVPNDGGGSGGRKALEAGGIPSDIAYANLRLEQARKKLTSGLSGPTSKEYQDSYEFKKDSEEVNKWAENITMLKGMGDNFKTTKVVAAKATNSYAMAGGKALAKDTTTGQYLIVGVDDILTERVKDDKGKVVGPRFVPATIPEAVRVRFDDPNFSGFIPETGGVLDNILLAAQDPEVIEKGMNAMFSRVGSVNTDNNTLVRNDGKVSSIEELLSELDQATAVYGSGSTKTNQKNLQDAVALFSNSMDPIHREALRNKVMSQFMAQWGNKEVPNPAAALDWIEAKVNSDIAQRAAAYLKVSQGKAAGGSSSGSDDLSKKEIFMNKIEQTLIGGTNVTKISTNAYDDAEDLKDRLTELSAVVPSGALNIREAVLGANKETNDKTNILATNEFISKLTYGDLTNNLFLADKDSTPVKSLNGGKGLETSAVNTTANAGPMQLLRGMPYTETADGRKIIAWDKVTEAIEAGKEYKKRADKRMGELGVDRLSEKEDIALLKKMAEDGFNFMNDPSIKTGDVAMIPIIVWDTDKGFDEKSLDSFMQSGVSGEEKALIDPWGPNALRKGQAKRTYAFTIIRNDATSMLRDAYGPAMEVKDKQNVGDIFAKLKSSQLAYKKGFDFKSYFDQAAMTNLSQE